MDRMHGEPTGMGAWSPTAPVAPPVDLGSARLRDVAACAVEGPAFEVRRPQRLTSPLVFASPHSGRIYPRQMVAAAALDPVAIRRSEDAFVDELFASVTTFGAPLIVARYARAFVDVNREPFEMDPALFRDPLPGWVRTASARAAAGLGSVARVVGEGQEIYRGKLHFAEAQARIEAVHRPYHAALESLLEAAERRFGISILIDCHSMPSSAVAQAGAGRAPDVVLGDRFGAACDPRVTARAEAGLRAQGLTVSRNAPYAGGWTTEHYGRPKVGRHALQIEVARSLYLNERTLKPSAAMPRLAARLEAACERLAGEDWAVLAG